MGAPGVGVAADEEKKKKMNGTVTTAYCPVCMMTKPLTDFGADKRQPDGRHRWCRSCVSAKRTAQRRKQRADDPIYQERLRRRREAAEFKARLILELGNEEMARKKARLLARGDKRWERYKLDPASYEAMLEAQRHRCAICRKDLTDDVPHIDHNHKCCPGKETCGECVRGILCRSCNMKLGWYEKHGAAINAYIVGR